MGTPTRHASRPWFKPGMSDADIRVWEAAERCASEAPELDPSDDVWLALQPLIGGCLTHPDTSAPEAHDPAA